LASPSFRNPNELVNSAAQLKAKGHIDEALCHLNEAIRIQPDHVEALLQKAMLLWEEKDLLDEALFSFSEAINMLDVLQSVHPFGTIKAFFL
jgi:tetratricopeptide (TPR) repeat protein